ncbi:unnamed protein product [Calypogeia fissa]
MATHSEGRGQYMTPSPEWTSRIGLGGGRVPDQGPEGIAIEVKWRVGGQHESSIGRTKLPGEVAMPRSNIRAKNLRKAQGNGAGNQQAWRWAQGKLGESR